MFRDGMGKSYPGLRDLREKTSFFVLSFAQSEKGCAHAYQPAASPAHHTVSKGEEGKD